MASDKITISDVARGAGVAQSTVSLVLNKRGRVSQETRQRVQKVMEELGYVPRPNSSRPRRHVAVLYSWEMIFCTELVRYCRDWITGIREALGMTQAADISVYCGRKHVSEDQMFQVALEEGDFDGLILMGMLPRHGYLERAVDSKLPLVVLNNRPVTTEFSCVALDHHTAGRLVAEHLIGLGHRRIGVMHRTTRDRNLMHEGMLQRLAEHDGRLLPLINTPGWELDFNNIASFDELARTALDMGATAIFTGDPAVYRLANALSAMGVDVPGRMSLVGFDNLGIKTESGLRITSVDYDTRDMGRLAARTLESLWAAGSGVMNYTVNVPVRLHRGQTTAPCPQLAPADTASPSLA